MPNPKKATGDLGERIAEEYLARQGYVLVARNFRTRLGEIDRIMHNGRYLLFVEVKARKPGSMVSAEEAVGYRKQQRLRAAAEYYLATHVTDLQPRFDVVCIDMAADGVSDIRWIENAF